jgi:hypothetical protein
LSEKELKEGHRGNSRSRYIKAKQSENILWRQAGEEAGL